MEICALSPELSGLDQESQKNLTKLYAYLSIQPRPEKALRDLKKEFYNWTTIAEDLDQYVQLGILERYDRRYRFCLPQITELEQNNYRMIANNLLVKILPLSDEEGVMLAQELIKQEQSYFYLGESSTLEKWSVTSVFGERLNFVDVIKDDEITGLASYFNRKSHEKSAVKEIRERIGDVDVPFFMTFTERVYDMLGVEPKNKVKETIFTKTLTDLGYVKYTQDTQLPFLAIPKTIWNSEDNTRLLQIQSDIDVSLSEATDFIKQLIKHMLAQELLSSLTARTYVFTQGDDLNND